MSSGRGARRSKRCFRFSKNFHMKFKFRGHCFSVVITGAGYFFDGFTTTSRILCAIKNLDEPFNPNLRPQQILLAKKREQEDPGVFSRQCTSNFEKDSARFACSNVSAIAANKSFGPTHSRRVPSRLMQKAGMCISSIHLEKHRLRASSVAGANRSQRSEHIYGLLRQSRFSDFFTYREPSVSSYR